MNIEKRTEMKKFLLLAVSALLILSVFSISIVAAQTCGNSIVETGEQCDDGNTAGFDGCSESCLTEIIHRELLSDTGIYLVTACSTDNAGNAACKNETIKIDVDKPVTNINVEGTLIGGKYLMQAVVNLIASDIGSGIFNTYYKINSGNWITYLTSFAVSDMGQNIVRYFSEDIAGNNETAKSETIDIIKCIDDDNDGYGQEGYTNGCLHSEADCDDTVASCNLDCSSQKYQDADDDGYGNNGVSLRACDAPAGYISDNTDCVDSNVAIHPGVAEICDGIDNNCVDGIDENGICPETAYYCDTDNDGYKSAIPSGTCNTFNCIPSDCIDTNGNDCNDADAAVNPGVAEICNGIDDNCNSQIDEGVKTAFYLDSDSDNYGDLNVMEEACTAPQGYVSNSNDCDDTNAAVNPAATEICNGIDDNCNSQIDEGVKSTFYLDNDGDTYGDASQTIEACSAPSGFVSDNTDCNDNDAAIHPGATEICNGIDDNCDNQIDENNVCPSGAYYCDDDSDGYISMTNKGECDTYNCMPSGCTREQGDDCDDNNAAVHPNAIETCNEIDDDCDAEVDENVKSTFYYDSDGDGYGDISQTIEACTALQDYVTDYTDCDDNDATVHPEAIEQCNGIDDDCDGATDEGVKSTFYQDNDGDSFGNPAVSILECNLPPGYSTDNTDCNDDNSNINPFMNDVCNGIDDNCDGQIDQINGQNACSNATYYCDGDNDAFISAIPSGTCNTYNCIPANCVEIQGNDCNDADAAVNPGVAEVCNGIDDNCNSQIDEGVKTAFYQDSDSDGYGNLNVMEEACAPPQGYVSNSNDCDDSDTNVNPGATETCNEIDDNCDGQIDEGVKSTFYRDADSDGYGDPAITTQACSAPSGYVSGSTDCNDADAYINPGATEICNNIDDNCDNQIDENNVCPETAYYCDDDSDSYIDAMSDGLCASYNCIPQGCIIEQGTDCDDLNAAVNPAATEICNNIDDNCNSQIDEGVKTAFYQDSDSDGYGNLNVMEEACAPPQGYVSNSNDCDDSNANVNPGATEICNGIDDNCDGTTDEGVKSTFYRDADSDNYGDASVTILACTAPQGYVSDNTDCNDDNSNINPFMNDVCNGIDDNCDGQIDQINGQNACSNSTYYCDGDNDAFISAIPSGTCNTYNCIPANCVEIQGNDCNDADAAVNPGVAEVCNGIDDNCNGDIDEDVKSTFYRDADSDNYGDPAITALACSAPSGYVSDSADCDDSNANVNPGATEVCNGIDDDCDGYNDEGDVCPATSYYCDNDLDGYISSSPSGQCDSYNCIPSGCNDIQGDDCNDNNAAVHPNAIETCNEIDDDCDAEVDEGVQSTFYIDADSDSYGDSAITAQSCSVPTGYVSNSADCDDANAAVNPGATETCNEVDDNCDGQIDEGVKSTFYQDSDGDNYGNAAVTALACSAPLYYVSDNTDCNDGNANVNPSMNEVCNGIDDNCINGVDEGGVCGTTSYYCDSDSDTFISAIPSGSCITFNCIPTGCQAAQGDDCNDNNAAVHPDAVETCNGIDDNCDGNVDEGVQSTFYIDADSDGYGDSAITIQDCSAPSGYVSDSTDCNDQNTAVNPGAAEVCNYIDDNCDNQIDENDQTPPVTADNAPAGWINYNPIVQLTSADNSGGCGAKEIDYNLDNSGWVSVLSNIVNVPVIGEGVHNLDYYGIDSSGWQGGNKEAQHSKQINIDLTAPIINISITPKTWSECAANGWFFWLVWFVDSGQVTYPLAHGCVEINANINAQISGLQNYNIKLYNSNNNLVAQSSNGALDFNFDTDQSSYKIVVEALDNANNYATTAMQIYEDDDQDYVPDMLDMCPSIKPATDANHDGCPDEAGVPSTAWDKCLDIYSGPALTNLYPINVINIFTGQTIFLGRDKWYGFNSNISGIDTVSYIDIDIHGNVMQCQFDLKEFDSTKEKDRMERSKWYRCHKYAILDKDVKIQEENTTRNYNMQETWKLDLDDGGKIRANQQYNSNQQKTQIQITYENNREERICDDACEDNKRSCSGSCNSAERSCGTGCHNAGEACDDICENTERTCSNSCNSLPKKQQLQCKNNCESAERSCSNSCDNTERSCSGSCNNAARSCNSNCGSAERDCKDACRDANTFNFNQDYTGMKTISLYDIMKLTGYA